MVSNRLPEILFSFNLYKGPLCHTLSNVLDMSNNTPRTSRQLSNYLYISCVIKRIWLINETPGLNPDWLWDIKLFFVKDSNILSYNILSNIYSAMGSEGIGQ